MTTPEGHPFTMSTQRPEVDAIPTELRQRVAETNVFSKVPYPEEWPPTDETPMTLTLPVKDVRALAAHLRHVRPIDVEFDPGWLADELAEQAAASRPVEGTIGDIDPNYVANGADQEVFSMTVRVARAGRTAYEIENELLAHIHSFRGYSASTAGRVKRGPR
jgi:hypothetical protein